MNNRTFHNADLNSPRIAKLLKFLKERGKLGATTMEMCDACQTTRASSDVSELRANGIEIEAEYIGLTESKAKCWRYRLVTRVEEKEVYQTKASVIESSPPLYGDNCGTKQLDLIGHEQALGLKNT